MRTAAQSAEVLVVVVTYNSAHVVGGLLDSLPHAFGDIRYHVVVVDNGSTDRTVEVVGARDDCRVIEATNRGYAAGVNLGVSATASQADILVLNADVVLAKNCVQPLVRALTRPDAGIAVPKVLDRQGTVTQSLRREPTLWRALGLTMTRAPLLSEYVTGSNAYNTAHVVDWALGAAMLVSRDTHTRLGGWDESFFLYSEETDLCLRARDAGLLTWFEPAAEVIHIGGQSGQSAATHCMQIVNRVRLYGRRHRRPATLAYWALAVASQAKGLAAGQAHSGAALAALIRPRRRPTELSAGQRLLPS